MKSVSIVVPTKNRPDELSCFLNSLPEAGDSYNELLIIDSSTTREVLNRNELNTLKAKGKHIIFNVKGLSRARNKGIKESKGDIIVFADDDFVARKGWVNSLISNFDDPEVFCVTGRMISYRDDDASKLYEKAMSFDRGSKRRVFSKNDLRIVTLLSTITKAGQKRLHDKTPVPWAVGYGFCAFRRQVFQDIDFFDENLGRGTRSVGGDDVDMFYRLLKTGHRIVYEPNAIVFHNHRVDTEQIFKDARQAGISMRSFITKYSSKDIYSRCIFFGYFFLIFFSMLGAILKSDHKLRRMIKSEFYGFLRAQAFTRT